MDRWHEAAHRDRDAEAAGASLRVDGISQARLDTRTARWRHDFKHSFVAEKRHG